MMKTLQVIFISGLIMMAACYDENDYLESNEDPTTSLILTSDEQEIIADGESTTYVWCELPINIKSDKTTITFTTTKGTFENTTKTISKAATIQHIGDKNKRIARVKLTSSSKIEIATIEASVGDITTSKDISFVSPTYDDYLTLVFDSTRIAADGVTSTAIAVRQPIYAKDDFSSIVFTTTKGSFENGTKTLTKSSIILLENGVYVRKAVVTLTGTTIPSLAVVEATIKNTGKKATIEMYKALPDSVQINTSSLSIASGFNNSVTLTTILTRGIGTPSQGNRIKLEVSDKDGNPIGSFINYNDLSDPTGSIINKFTLGESTYKGKLTIKSSATNAKGTKLSKEITITAI